MHIGPQTLCLYPLGKAYYLVLAGELKQPSDGILYVYVWVTLIEHLLCVRHRFKIFVFLEHYIYFLQSSFKIFTD